MLQNLKVDIIYYKTNTDFEMEFNLCGCCRMRLLTDKASDKKTLVHDLARAVSRSRVIIIAGKLSGEEGIIEITAKSIAKTVTEVDKGMYGIKSDEKIGVINGATPLVTPDGEFGGCIIESGPQSMILLSDNRELRKTVMQTLIHPYIEELCTLELKKKTNNAEPPAPAVIPAAEPSADGVPEETDAALETPDTPSKETENVTEEEAAAYNEAKAADDSGNTEKTEDMPEQSPEAESETQTEEAADKSLSSFSSKPDGVTLEGGMTFVTDDYCAAAEPPQSEEESELFIEPSKLKKGREEYYNNSYVPDAEDDSPYRTSDDSAEDFKPRFSGNLPILIISVLLLIVLAVLCYCIFYVPAKDGVTASAYLSETFNTLFG